MEAHEEGRNGRRDNPDLTGCGAELLDTFQIIKDQEFKMIYLTADMKYTFSSNFEYPLVFIFVRSDSAVMSLALAIDIPNASSRQGLIEEKFIAPMVCETLGRDEIVNYFASIVEGNIHFAYYINHKPPRHEEWQFHHLEPSQQVVLNEHLALAVMKVLDDRKTSRKTE